MMYDANRSLGSRSLGLPKCAPYFFSSDFPPNAVSQANAVSSYV
jgi:hypothetical protein